MPDDVARQAGGTDDSVRPARRPSKGDRTSLTMGELRARIAELERVRVDLPPHAAQGLREELDQRLSHLRRLAARRHA